LHKKYIFTHFVILNIIYYCFWIYSVNYANLSHTNFFSEDGLGLTTKPLLFAVVTPSALRGMSLFTLFILRHFVSLVYFAFFAKSTPLLRHVNL